MLNKILTERLNEQKSEGIRKVGKKIGRGGGKKDQRKEKEGREGGWEERRKVILVFAKINWKLNG